MLKHEKNKLKQDSEKKNISETVIRKKENISKNSDKEKYKWKNVKNNEKTKCFPRGERGAVAKTKPKKLLVS